MGELKVYIEANGVPLIRSIANYKNNPFIAAINVIYDAVEMEWNNREKLLLKEKHEFDLLECDIEYEKAQLKEIKSEIKRLKGALDAIEA